MLTYIPSPAGGRGYLLQRKHARLGQQLDLLERDGAQRAHKVDDGLARQVARGREDLVDGDYGGLRQELADNDIQLPNRRSWTNDLVLWLERQTIQYY